jgi:lipoprotein-anchoring transpeptidase ErfK/SrfK
VELPRTENGARLSMKLEPDAEYRLRARAEPAHRITLPWQPATPEVLSIERVFGTVRAPVVEEEDTPPLLIRGQPLELRFNEPLADLTVALGDLDIQASISKTDARLVRIDVTDPPAGKVLPLELSNVIARNGAETELQVIDVETPQPLELVAIGGGKPGDRVAVPQNTPVSLTWGEPVTLISYSLGGRTARWQGEPTTETVLPLRLGQGESEALVVVDARGDSGSWLSRRITMEVYAPEALQVVALWPTDGAERIPPRADPTFRFSEAITDREAAEKAIRFDPPVPGRFEWLAPNRVRFLPETRFPSETPISMEVVHGLDGVRGESGSFLTSAVRAGFTTGKMKVIDVSLSGQRIALIEEGQTVWSAPVATGVRGAETPPGTYEVQYKMATARFRGSNPDGSRYDIPNVHWVLAFYGDYTIHGAWWRNVFGRPGSAGCISMTDANAKVVFDWADVGTPVVVRG